MSETRYTPEQILDIRNILADYGNIPCAARRAIDQLMGDLENCKDALEMIASIGDTNCRILAL